VPNIIESEVDAYAWCPGMDGDGLPCEGVAQEVVKGFERTTEVLYMDRDPNGIPGVENSFTQVTFLDPEKDGTCKLCSVGREISTQKRPVYKRDSGVSDIVEQRRRALREEAHLDHLRALTEALPTLRVADAPASEIDRLSAELEAIKAERAADLEAAAAEAKAVAARGGAKKATA
jgi:hypothetical protein